MPKTIEELIEMENKEKNRASYEPKCPWCGCTDDIDFEREELYEEACTAGIVDDAENLTEIECSECGRKYKLHIALEIEVSYDYTVTKIYDNDEEEADPFIDTKEQVRLF